jgi:hypothetical protein
MDFKENGLSNSMMKIDWQESFGSKEEKEN